MQLPPEFYLLYLEVYSFTHLFLLLSSKLLLNNILLLNNKLI